MNFLVYSGPLLGTSILDEPPGLVFTTTVKVLEWRSLLVSERSFAHRLGMFENMTYRFIVGRWGSKRLMHGGVRLRNMSGCLMDVWPG